MAQVTMYPEYDAQVSRIEGGSYASCVSGDGTLSLTTIHQVGVTHFPLVMRVYSRFDTTSIPTSATITSATIKRYMYDSDGTTTSGETIKAFQSDDLSSDDASLYQSFTSTDSDTTIDVGTAVEWKTFTIDGDLLTYLQTQVTAGNKTAVILRNQMDYDVITPSVVEVKRFYGLDDDDVSGEDYRPYLTVNYTTGTPVKLKLNSGVLRVKGGKLTIG